MKDVSLEAWEIRMLIQAVQHCRKVDECMIGWGRGDYKRIACRLSREFGWRETKEIFPNLYYECWEE